MDKDFLKHGACNEELFETKEGLLAKKDIQNQSSIYKVINMIALDTLFKHYFSYQLHKKIDTIIKELTHI